MVILGKAEVDKPEQYSAWRTIHLNVLAQHKSRPQARQRTSVYEESGTNAIR